MQPRSHDLVTLSAIGVVTGLLLMLTHEVLGHGLATVAIGARLVHVTSVDSSYSGSVSDDAMRTIAAAGIAANLLVGIAVAALSGRVAGGSSFRFFLALYGYANVFMGSAYLAGFAFLPFGDVAAALRGLPDRLALQIVLVLVGAGVYCTALHHAARAFTPWRSSITRTAYVAMGIAVTLTAAWNPRGSLLGTMWGAAATLGANYGLVGAAQHDDERSTLTIRRSPAWIVAGFAAAGMLAAVLGPGVPR